MHTSAALLLELGLILAVLSVLGTLARRLTLSPVPLYLLAGLFIGEGGLAPVPAAGEFLATGATIGVVLLLLTLGLEFSTREFLASLRHHIPSAAFDLLNAVPGVAVALLLGLDLVGVVAMAGVTYVSSSGIVARLLSDLRRLGNRETPAVLSVLVLEDFAMAIYLPVLAVLAVGDSWWRGVLGVAFALAVVAVALVVSERWGRRLSHLVAHPDAEQLMLRVLGITLVVAGLAELVNVSAAVGAFLVGLTLSGSVAERARQVLSPLRDLFAAAFFLAVGYAVGPAALLPLLPLALGLAVVSAMVKVATGWFAAARDGIGRRGRLRAGTALIAHGEFSIVVVGLIGTGSATVGPLVVGYVLILAVLGPVATRFADTSPRSQPAAA